MATMKSIPIMMTKEKTRDGLESQFVRSMNMSNTSQVDGISKECLFCKQTFIDTHKSRIRKYCSRSCLHKAYWRRKGRTTQGFVEHTQSWIKRRKENLTK